MNGSYRIQALEESQTLALSKRVRELKAEGKDILNLTLGEPDFVTPNHIRDAASLAIAEGFTHYTPVSGILELRQAVADKFRKYNSLPYSASNIVISTGAKQSLINAIMVLVNPGDEVIMPVPFWVSYAEMVKMAEAKSVLIQTGIEQGFKMTAAQLEATITDKTRMLIFSSPSNPAGAMFTQQELSDIVQVLLKHPNIFVISDEIYEFIAYDTPHISIGSFPEIFDRVITINGVSKGFAMTGWRVGFMGAAKWIADLCDKFQGQVTSGTCSISQKAALAAMTSDLGPTYQMTEIFKQRRAMFYDYLKMIPGFQVSMPQGAFYMYPDISGLFGKKTPSGITLNTPTDVAAWLLEDAGVALVPGEAFGTDKHLRLSFACSEKVLEAAAERILLAVRTLVS